MIESKNMKENYRCAKSLSCHFLRVRNLGFHSHSHYSLTLAYDIATEKYIRKLFISTCSGSNSLLFFPSSFAIFPCTFKLLSYSSLLCFFHKLSSYKVWFFNVSSIVSNISHLAHKHSHNNNFYAI